MLKLHTLTMFLGLFFKKAKALTTSFLRWMFVWIKMLEHNRIDISEGIAINKTNA